MARKPPVVSQEFRVSQRVTLRTGDKFRAKGGPYWKTSDGVHISLASHGPYTFHRHCAQGNYEWIESLDRDGAFAPLHIALLHISVLTPGIGTSGRRAPSGGSGDRLVQGRLQNRSGLGLWE